MRRSEALMLILLLLSACRVSYDFNQEELRFFRLVQPIMTKREEKIFKSLSHQERKEFMRDFWLSRDPDPSTPQNEFYQEYMRRVRIAAKFFREGSKPGWLTDRGRIFVVLGPPDIREAHPFVNIGRIRGYEIWIYERFRLRLEFVDREGNGFYMLTSYTPSLWYYVEQGKRTLFLAEKGRVLKEFPVIWLRVKEGKLEVEVPARSLSFRKEKDRFETHFLLEAVFFSRQGGSRSYREEKRVSLRKKEVRKKSFKFYFPLQEGDYRVRVILKDFVSGAKILRYRYFLKGELK